MNCYNIGAGAFSQDGWTNIDMSSAYYAPIQRSGFIEYDMMRLEPLPIETASADLIYSAQTIEHVTDDAASNVLRESHRILKPGGIIRLVTPCAKLIWRAYHNRDIEFMYELGKSARSGATTVPEVFLDMFGSQLCAHNPTPGAKWHDEKIEDVVTSMPRDEALDLITGQCTFSYDHPSNHVNWFTPGKLERMLREAGFSEVYRSGAGQSAAPPMRDLRKGFDEYHHFSLYMEAVR